MRQAVVLAVVGLLAGRVLGAREVFRPAQGGGAVEVWRVTNEPAIRHWANYHNTQSWSPSGRYICYTRYAHDGKGYGDALDEVHVYDAHKDESRLVERGFFPRWGWAGDRLYFARLVEGKGKGRGNARAPEVRCLDMETGECRTLAPGVENLGEVTHDGRWLLGAKRFRGQEPEFVVVRIGLPGGEIQELPEVVGSQLMPNPRHPVFFTRQDHKREAFGATRWFYDLDGKNRRMAVPTVQQCHMSWLGNGEYLLLGNGLVRGRRWDEPYPSNVHFLAAVAVGDISPCGASGRYVCGDERVADLRSGDGWETLDPLSVICYPASVADDSGIYDADPKGSPDGTKISFVSNYDLKDGPVAEIEDLDSRGGGSLRVKSTAGFPEKGSLVLQREVIGYARKTANAFEGLTRELHGTQRCSAKPGRLVTSFEALCLTDAQWASVPGAPSGMRKSIGEKNAALLRQRQTDLYVAVVRRPDRPVLRAAGDAVQLIPGEEHRETRGYYLRRGEQRVPREGLVGAAGGAGQTLGAFGYGAGPLRPCGSAGGHFTAAGGSGQTLGAFGYGLRGLCGPCARHDPSARWPGQTLGAFGCGAAGGAGGRLEACPPVEVLLQPGEYRAVAVEWSGIESEPGPPIKVTKAARLVVLAKAPGDFSWVKERWLVGGREATADAAKAAPEAIRESVHLLDGVIQKEWYRKGALALRHDLNAAGKAIRRQSFQNGKLALREYYGADERPVGKEIFDADGFITESIRYQTRGETTAEDDHWWYERGVPVKRAASGKTSVKRGEDWVGE